MSIPRKQHFVPQFYLAGFTPSGLKTDGLYVLDRHSRKQWKAGVGDTGCQRDFDMLEVEGDDDPLAVDKFFQGVETRAADAMRVLVQRREIPIGDDYTKLAEFLGIMSVRVPGVRNTVDRFIGDVVKKVNYHITSEKVRWEAALAAAKVESASTTGATWEKVRAMVEHDQYTVEPSQNMRMELLLSMLKPAAATMAARKWTLLEAPPHGAGFICSDRPLSLSWTDPSVGNFLPPGFASRGTSVIFPVSKLLALVGRFEGSGGTVLADANTVGYLNMWTALSAERYIYTSGPELTVTLPSGKLGGKKELLDCLTLMADAAEKASAAEVDLVLTQLANGLNVNVDARRFRIEQIRKIGTATAISDSGILTVTHSNVFTDAQRAMSLPKVKFV